MKTIKDYSLYLIITEEYGNGRKALEIAKQAIKGGVDVIQMREKKKNASELIALGKELADLCRRNGVTFIVNDDPMLARAVNADGVHLGQEDVKMYPPEKCRNILGRNKIVGVSTATMEEFSEANRQDFDYIAFGPVFRTEIKAEYSGTMNIAEILQASSKPVVFIGGITLNNVEELFEKGAKNVSLIRGIIQKDDIAKSAKDFRAAIDKYREKFKKNG